MKNSYITDIFGVDCLKEKVFYKNDKFLFTYITVCNSTFEGYIEFYDIDSIINKDNNLKYLLDLPVEKIEGVSFEKSTLILDEFYEISCVVSKNYRLRVFTPNIRFELYLTPNKITVNKLFNARTTEAVKILSNMYSDDELMLKYTNFHVDKQKNNSVIVVDYNVDFKSDYLFELGTRINVNKPMLFRYNNLDLSLYDEFMFGNVGNELSVVDMSKVKVDMHSDIVFHSYCEDTIFNKGIWLLKKEHNNIEMFMELSSTYFQINVYNIDDFPKNVQQVIKKYISLDKKDICNFFVKTLLIKPDVIEFIRTHNGIWYL